MLLYQNNFKRGTSLAVKLFQSSNILKPHHLATDPLREIILSNIQGLAGITGQEGLEPSPKALIIEVVLGTGFEPVVFRMKIWCPRPARRTEHYTEVTWLLWFNHHFTTTALRLYFKQGSLKLIHLVLSAKRLTVVNTGFYRISENCLCIFPVNLFQRALRFLISLHYLYNK